MAHDTLTDADRAPSRAEILTWLLGRPSTGFVVLPERARPWLVLLDRVVHALVLLALGGAVGAIAGHTVLPTQATHHLIRLCCVACVASVVGAGLMALFGLGSRGPALRGGAGLLGLQAGYWGIQTGWPFRPFVDWCQITSIERSGTVYQVGWTRGCIRLRATASGARIAAAIARVLDARGRGSGPTGQG